MFDVISIKSSLNFYIKVETLEQFYKKSKNWMPDDFRNGIGHFNIFRIPTDHTERRKPLPYQRRDYFKISFTSGNPKINYADKVIQVQKQALVFSNPYIPYTWDKLEDIQGGCFCIFNQNFFHQYGDLNQYTVFQPNGTHVFELSDEQASKVTAIYERMFEEINFDYIYKYDVLKTLAFELLHFAMKMQPSSSFDAQPINASHRISLLFSDLLERQFPIVDPRQTVHLRSAIDFAGQLNIYVNHLNRAVKEITGKTTSQLIAERILQEAKILLKHISWTVSKIGYALGFSEIAHFNNFFKKHTQLSPLKFRNG